MKYLFFNDILSKNSSQKINLKTASVSGRGIKNFKVTNLQIDCFDEIYLQPVNIKIQNIYMNGVPQFSNCDESESVPTSMFREETEVSIDVKGVGPKSGLSFKFENPLDVDVIVYVTLRCEL